MREFDHEGLLLAEFQAKLFEASYDLTCSSPVFIRRFRYSSVVDVLDQNYTAFIDGSVSEYITKINDEYKNNEYGSKKYPRCVLFWMGYLYRYISYTREQSTNFVMTLFNHKLLNEVYYVYHTQSMEWCVKSLLNVINLDEDIFDNDKRLKKIIKSKNKEI